MCRWRSITGQVLAAAAAIDIIAGHGPKCCRWTRIWCIRPVSGMQRTMLSPPTRLSRTKVVLQAFPSGDTAHTPTLWLTIRMGSSHTTGPLQGVGVRQHKPKIIHGVDQNVARLRRRQHMHTLERPPIRDRGIPCARNGMRFLSPCFVQQS